ncbi:MAG: ribonuclease HI family protein [bacterium]
MSKKIKLYTDGGARGNPGPAGIGAVLKDENGKNIAEISEYIGETTNNQAEYKALIAGLERAKEIGAGEIECFLDSELVVKQMKREYKVKNEDLAPLFVIAWNLILGFKKISFTHVMRQYNQEADKLVNKAIDLFQKSKKTIKQ